MVVLIASFDHSVNESGDLMLCYHALVYFLRQECIDYVHLTDLALIIHRSLSNTKTCIPSKMDYILIYAIYTMVSKRIGNDFFKGAQQRDERILFVESLYECLYSLVLRCSHSLLFITVVINLHIPISTDMLECLLYPIGLYLEFFSVGNVRMSLIRNSAGGTTNRSQPVTAGILSICISALEVYSNAGIILIINLH